MPHYNREWQLSQTLSTISKTKHDNFFVIVIDDASDKPLYLPDYNFKVEVINISKEEKADNNWIMPLPQMNIAIKKALELGVEILILQNAEARHKGDVLMYVENNLTVSNYLSFACYSLSMNSTYDPDIEENIDKIIESNNKCAVDGEHDSWYNHPLYRGTCYDFCAAITRENIIKLNGYDERYATGFCYGDDDFIMRIRRLGLFVDIPTNPFVLHQWHGNSMGNRSVALIEENRDLYHFIANNETGYKAKHTFTEDL